jgi:hypothetical protein
LWAVTDLSKRARIVLSLLGSVLLIVALVLPWWSATAHLPDGTASAQLTLYSFQFRTSSFSCTAILLFYSYGNCPLLGSAGGVAMLAFYLFWTLFFLALSFCLGIISAVLLVKGYAQQLSWLPAASTTLNALSNLSFIGSISTAGMKFVSGSALYGSSNVLSWSISPGFVFAISSTLLQLTLAYYARRTI